MPSWHGSDRAVLVRLASALAVPSGHHPLAWNRSDHIPRVGSIPGTVDHTLCGTATTKPPAYWILPRNDTTSCWFCQVAIGSIRWQTERDRSTYEAPTQPAAPHLGSSGTSRPQQGLGGYRRDSAMTANKHARNHNRSERTLLMRSFQCLDSVLQPRRSPAVCGRA